MANQPKEENFSDFGKSLFNVEVNYFSYIDYGLFAIMLLISTIIGIYYGFISKRKQDNTAEYILGNKEMSVLPVAASLIASHISGISMLALPADIYAHGTQYVMSFICLIIVALAVIYIYLPVFYELKVTSCFTYLEKRFDKRVKTTASLVFALFCMLFIPIVIYVPALAFNQVSGVNIHFITVGISVLCIFYTSVGGLRAVVWTDTIQFVSIVGAMAAVVYLGTVSQGGIKEILKIAKEGERLEIFNMDPNPFQRMSFWSITIGMSTMWIYSKGITQSTVQRCLSLPNMKSAQRCIWLSCFGIYVLQMTSVYVGLLMFAEYKNCDPLSFGAVNKLDQILPLYIMKIAGKIPGLPGLFIAGIFAAALSSMSSVLNSLSGTIFEDLIKPNLKNVSEKTSSTIMKIIVLCVGMIELGMVFAVERLGTIMHLAYSFHGVTAGTLLGIFTIGMLSRRVNTRGVIAGSIVSILTVGTILIGAQVWTRPPALPMETTGCYLNSTGVSTSTQIWMEKIQKYSEVPPIFRTSFLYYAFVGVVTMVVVAYPVSLVTNKPQPVDEELLAPFLRSKNSKEAIVSYASNDNSVKIVGAES